EGGRLGVLFLAGDFLVLLRKLHVEFGAPIFPDIDAREQGGGVVSGGLRDFGRGAGRRCGGVCRLGLRGRCGDGRGVLFACAGFGFRLGVGFRRVFFAGGVFGEPGFDLFLGRLFLFGVFGGFRREAVGREAKAAENGEEEAAGFHTRNNVGWT